MSQDHPIYERSPLHGPLRQAEIISGLFEIRPDLSTMADTEGPIYQALPHGFSLIISQDCDLDLDYKARYGDSINQDKLVPSILFCELEVFETFLSRTGKTFNWKDIRDQKLERFQFLEGAPVEYDALDASVPELVLDFKRFFSLPTEVVYSQVQSRTMHSAYYLVDENGNDLKANRRCILRSPYLEHISRRFTNFLSRIALPEPHKSE